MNDKLAKRIFVGADVGASRTKVAILDPDKNLIGHATEKSGTNFTATADKCLSQS
ncbi:MAG: ATPase, partial [Desulfobacterales bacterium]|nr:ATPase [Desulfobacterales bacterium]